MSTTAELRKENRNRIFRYIYETEQQVTKQDIAQTLSLSLPTVNQNLKELMDMGLAEYSGTVDSTGGRRPKSIGITSQARCSVGIMLSSQHLRIVLIDLKASVLAEKKVRHSFGYDEVYCRKIAEELELFLDENEVDRNALLGVGIAIPGIPNQDGSVIHLASFLEQRTMDGAMLKNAIPYPCFIENDANAGGIAEWWNHPGIRSMAYLSVQKGVGGAVLLDGVQYMGRHHHSGEFGHMCIMPGGKACNCGRKGCLEAYCSTARLSTDLGIPLEEFFDRLEQGNQDYHAIWSEYLEHLATGINNIRMVLDCDVVLGGVLAQYIEPYLPELYDLLKARNSFNSDGSYLQICRYRSWSTCVGAALHFISSFIEKI